MDTESHFHGNTYTDFGPLTSADCSLLIVSSVSQTLVWGCELPAQAALADFMKWWLQPHGCESREPASCVHHGHTNTPLVAWLEMLSSFRQGEMVIIEGTVMILPEQRITVCCCSWTLILSYFWLPLLSCYGKPGKLWKMFLFVFLLLHIVDASPCICRQEGCSVAAWIKAYIQRWELLLLLTLR